METVTVQILIQILNIVYPVLSVLPVSVAPHTQESGQFLKEEALYPGGHGVVAGRGAVVDVNDEDGNDDGEGDKNHDKEQVLSNERDYLGQKKGQRYILLLSTWKHTLLLCVLWSYTSTIHLNKTLAALDIHQKSCADMIPVIEEHL